MKTPDITLPDGAAWQVDNDATRLAQCLADDVAQRLTEALAQRGRASLVVSGGSTPVPFFRALAQKPLDWSGVDVLLADERWVDETDEASNSRLLREHLLQGPASAARYHALKPAAGRTDLCPGEISPQAVSAAERTLKAVCWPLDVLILGMGTDGHTASLFPDAPELAAALAPEAGARVAAMHPPSERQARLTLTLPALLDARYTALHLRGEAKLTTLLEAMRVPDGIAQMPIRAFLKPGVTVFWSP